MIFYQTNLLAIIMIYELISIAKDNVEGIQSLVSLSGGFAI